MGEQDGTTRRASQPDAWAACDARARTHTYAHTGNPTRYLLAAVGAGRGEGGGQEGVGEAKGGQEAGSGLHGLKEGKGKLWVVGVRVMKRHKKGEMTHSTLLWVSVLGMPRALCTRFLGGLHKGGDHVEAAWLSLLFLSFVCSQESFARGRKKTAAGDPGPTTHPLAVVPWHVAGRTGAVHTHGASCIQRETKRGIQPLSADYRCFCLILLHPCLFLATQVVLAATRASCFAVRFAFFFVLCSLVCQGIWRLPFILILRVCLHSVFGLPPQKRSIVQQRGYGEVEDLKVPKKVPHSTISAAAVVAAVAAAVVAVPCSSWPPPPRSPIVSTGRTGAFPAPS